MKNIKLFQLSFLFIIIFLILLRKKKIKIFKVNIKDELNNKALDYLYKNNTNKISLDSIKKLKKVVYSVILGNYDKIHPFNLQNGFDFILFTDISNINCNETNWTIFPLPNELKDRNISRVKKQRFIKLHPHLYFKNYNLSIYIDASFQIKGDLNQFLLRVITTKYKIYTFEHPARNKIFNETFAVVKSGKESQNLSKFIRERYKKEKFPDNNGLIESCLIIRKHNEREVIENMHKWYEEIEKYSHRDQLSFNYIAWKTGIKIKYISKRFTMNYFNKYGHIKKLQK